MKTGPDGGESGNKVPAGVSDNGSVPISCDIGSFVGADKEMTVEADNGSVPNLWIKDQSLVVWIWG